MQTQHQLRYRKRVPVEFDDGDGHHIGMVLNLSKGGLFVSSRVTPRVGTRVVLNFSGQKGSGTDGIPARVVWKRKVHRSANVLADGGIGLEIEGASEAYQDFIQGIVPGLAAASEPAAAEAAGTVIETTSTRFLVRAALVGTPRTRSFEIDAGSDEQARVRALETLGADWQILEVTPAERFAKHGDGSS